MLLVAELLVELVESGLVAEAVVLSIVLLVKSAEFVTLLHVSGPSKFLSHVTACLLVKYPKSFLSMGFEIDSKEYGSLNMDVDSSHHVRPVAQTRSCGMVGHC